MIVRALPIVFLGLFGLVWVGTLHAHRKPESLTTLSYNVNTRSTEIVHRLHIHDVEPNLDEILEEEGHSLETLEARARLALYVSSAFGIATSEEVEPFELTLVGAELVGDEVYVYQEYKGALPDKFVVRNDILRDVFEEQINVVTVALGDSKRSLAFSGKDRWKMFTNVPES